MASMKKAVCQGAFSATNRKADHFLFSPTKRYRIEHRSKLKKTGEEGNCLASLPSTQCSLQKVSFCYFYSCCPSFSCICAHLSRSTFPHLPVSKHLSLPRSLWARDSWSSNSKGTCFLLFASPQIVTNGRTCQLPGRKQLWQQLGSTISRATDILCTEIPVLWPHKELPCLLCQRVSSLTLAPLDKWVNLIT